MGEWEQVVDILSQARKGREQVADPVDGMGLLLDVGIRRRHGKHRLSPRQPTLTCGVAVLQLDPQNVCDSMADFGRHTGDHDGSRYGRVVRASQRNW